MNAGRWKFALGLIVCFLFSCKESKNSLIDNLLQQSEKEEFVEFKRENLSDFIYFKSGFFLDKSLKQAIFISISNEKTYKIEHYIFNNEKWNLINQLDSIEANPSQFEILINDYNFDGQSDFFIQTSASQGYSLSRGHLIIINPENKKFEIHREAKEFANMKRDSFQKVIFSELFHGYDSNDSAEISILTNKWIEGKLKNVKEERFKLKP